MVYSALNTLRRSTNFRCTLKFQFQCFNTLTATSSFTIIEVLVHNYLPSKWAVFLFVQTMLVTPTDVELALVNSILLQQVAIAVSVAALVLEIIVKSVMVKQ